MITLDWCDQSHNYKPIKIYNISITHQVSSCPLSNTTTEKATTGLTSFLLILYLINRIMVIILSCIGLLLNMWFWVFCMLFLCISSAFFVFTLPCWSTYGLLLLLDCYEWSHYKYSCACLLVGIDFRLS